jgi:hypothetical protein
MNPARPVEQRPSLLMIRVAQRFSLLMIVAWLTATKDTAILLKLLQVVPRCPARMAVPETAGVARAAR